MLTEGENEDSGINPLSLWDSWELQGPPGIGLEMGVDGKLNVAKGTKSFSPKGSAVRRLSLRSARLPNFSSLRRNSLVGGLAGE